jgi:undecaprenyl-diphosphatase
LALVRNGTDDPLFGGERRWLAVGAAALAAGLGIAIFLRLKKSTGRRRPCMFEPHCWATLLPPDQFSFPSGHTITAFAVAVSLSRFYPDLAAGLLFCAISVAASRIPLACTSWRRAGRRRHRYAGLRRHRILT